jgi:aminotransferase in exopolysaccharide biosynthesis
MPSEGGAAAARDGQIPLSVPSLGGNELKYLKDCLDTNWVSSVGPMVDQFEQRFADAVGVKHAVACSSGTAALHIAMRLVGVADGDEVVVSTLTFAGSLNPILYERGTPVFIDAERRTWNLDPQLVVDEIERRAKRGRGLPKAVEVVHVFGHPADIEPIAEVCGRYGLPLIEDAAESLGAGYTKGGFAGRSVGSIGEIGCFSFNGNKIVTTGSGGMLVTNDPELARRAKHLTTQARLPGLEYQHDEVGYNYRLSNIAAALGLAQLEQLEQFLERKRDIARRYDHALADLPGITLPPRENFATSSLWLYSVLVDEARFGHDRHAVIAALRQEGIDSRPLWTPLHTMKLYGRFPRRGGEVAERIFRHGLSLPCSVSLTPDAQDWVIRILQGMIGRASTTPIGSD